MSKTTISIKENSQTICKVECTKGIKDTKLINESHKKSRVCDTAINEFDDTEKVYPYTRPDIVIDYHYSNHDVGNVKFNNKGELMDVRKLISQNNSPRNQVAWQLGYKGWVIFAFSKGIKTSLATKVFVKEGGTKPEWMDIWVCSKTMFGNGQNHINYLPNNYNKQANRPKVPYTAYPTYKAPDGKAWYRHEYNNKYTPAEILLNGVTYDRLDIINPPPSASPPLLLQRPDWIGPQWRYTGTVRGPGKAAAPAAFGPPLNHLSLNSDKFMYLLIQDTGTFDLGGGGGADIVDIGIVQYGEMPKKAYFLLLVDDSASAKGTESIYENEIKRQLKEWFNMAGDFSERNIGVRFIRWPKDLCPKYNACDGAKKTNNPCKEKDTDNEESYDAFMGKTVRIIFSEIDKGVETKTVWIDMLKYKSFLDLWGKIIKPQVIARMRLDKFHTPLVEALDDVYSCDFKSKNNKKIKTMPVAIISDGIPDSYNKYTNPSKIKYDTELLSDCQKITEAIFGIKDGVVDGMLKEESVRAKLQKLKYSIAGKVTLAGKFPSDGSHWIKDIYNRAEMNDLVDSIFSLSLDTKVNVDGQFDHSIPHTDCWLHNNEVIVTRKINEDGSVTYVDRDGNIIKNIDANPNNMPVIVNENNEFTDMNGNLVDGRNRDPRSVQNRRVGYSCRKRIIIEYQDLDINNNIVTKEYTQLPGNWGGGVERLSGDQINNKVRSPRP